MEPNERTTIAIIDDDEDCRDLMATALGQAGYRVVSTGDPTTAVDLVRREQPALVLCDIAMPRMDGYAVVRGLQADAATRGIPVVFLTARTGLTDRVRAFRFGVTDYISKPVPPDRLLDRVNRLVNSVRERTACGGSGQAPILVGEPSAPALRIAAGGLPSGSLARAHASGQPAGAIAPLGETGRGHEPGPGRVRPQPPADDAPLPDFSEVPDALREAVIADDDPLFRAALRGLLERQGLRVREAAGGEEAVRIVLARPPSILIVDLGMPGLDGVEVCRRLRGHALSCHLPILFLSGHDDLGQRAGAVEAGGDDFLPKRTSPRELLLRIGLLLRRFHRPAAGSTPLRGQIELMGAASVLQLCHLTTLSGTLHASSDGRTASIGFRQGELVSADSTEAAGADAVYEFVAWDHGWFSFEATSVDGTPVDESLEMLLLEGCRRIDRGERRDPATWDASASGMA